MDFDLLSHIPASIDSVALEAAEDGSEAALFGSEAALKGLKHLSVAMRVFEVQVEGLWICHAVSEEAMLSAPQLNTALVVGVEYPHAVPPPARLLRGAIPPQAIDANMEDKIEARAGRM